RSSARAGLLVIIGVDDCQKGTARTGPRRERPPRHGLSKSELGPAGHPGKRQDCLNGVKGKEEENADVPPTLILIHPELALLVTPRRESDAQARYNHFGSHIGSVN